MPKQHENPVDDTRSDVISESSDSSSPSDSDQPTPSAPDPFAEEARPKEYGGRNGPDPVRYGDWEKNGRCIDF
ncbi:DUF1674 domain-containing protein [Salinisphaera hydrothermalis]|uniref:DUF1674 domain-containing protein n=1 Tax=Salinisphaera hydrothermalis TaxID=563188 RepID=UPI003353DF10